MATKNVTKIDSTGSLTKKMNNISRSKSSIKFLLCAVLLSGCTPAEMTNDTEQIDLACALVNGWPEDYATIWPLAVKRHNELPDTVSAGDEMIRYIDGALTLMTIDDPEAERLIDGYKSYWQLLEVDLINGGGVMPEDPISSGIVSSLMRSCDELGRGFSN
jgi:hypothetical protein